MDGKRIFSQKELEFTPKVATERLLPEIERFIQQIRTIDAENNRPEMDNFELDILWLLSELSQLYGRDIIEPELNQDDLEAFVERVAILCAEGIGEEEARREIFMGQLSETCYK